MNPNKEKINSRFSSWAWIGFDMGNSAHALMISTVGFALYFQKYLFKGDPNANFYWALLTAFILFISAVASPIITSLLFSKNKRAMGLMWTTIASVIATAALWLPLASDKKIIIIIFYVISAIGYYLALPIYNTYINQVSVQSLERTSAKGWGFGYIGGILVLLVCLLLGLLSQPVDVNPENYRWAFLVAAIFNLIFSLPLLWWTGKNKSSYQHSNSNWDIQKFSKLFRNNKRILNLLLSYWLIGEGATITVYFTAIFLAQYAGLEASTILKLTILVQIIAAISTGLTGIFADKYGPRNIFYIISFAWFIAPIALFSITNGLPYIYPLILIGLILGSYHSIVRAEVGRISYEIEDDEMKGWLFGFLEVAGRFSSIIGPLFVAIITFYFSLPIALLLSAIFPLVSLFTIHKYQWNTTANS